MTRIDADKVINIIQEVAEEHILPRFQNLRPDDIAFKIGDDPVTIADKEAEKALSTRLSDLLPGSKVVGEEGFWANRGILSHLSGESPVWILDPVDGTRNFVKGSCKFGVIVALSERNQTIAGFLYDPTSKQVVSAEKGAGAWFQDTKLKVLPPAPLNKSFGFLGDRLVAKYKKSNLSSKLEPTFKEMAAGVHEYPKLVIGGPHFNTDEPQAHFRASFMYSNPWDDAAGVLIHQEAGGYSAFWNGAAYNPSIMSQGLALAPNKECWQELKAWCQTFSELPASIP